MNESPRIVFPPCSAEAHADCLDGFHNPPGQPCICVPNNPPQDIPTLETWGLIGLLIAICSIAAVKLMRKPWND